MQEELFEKKVKPVLKYVGTIGAILMCIAYVAIICIMVFGFDISASITQTLTFALVNAVIGFIIMQLLKIQGIDFAKEIEENKEVLKLYYNTTTKEKKPKSLTYYWVTSFIKDILLKGAGIAATTMGVIYIVISGSHNYTMLLLAVVNIIMFICFGLLSLVNAYDFFNNEHIPYIKEVLNEREREKAEEAAKRENERLVAMAEEKLNQQRNAIVYSSGGSNILDTSVGSCAPCNNSGSMVVDSCECSNSVLGRSVYTSDRASISANICAQENTFENQEEKEC